MSSNPRITHPHCWQSHIESAGAAVVGVALDLGCCRLVLVIDGLRARTGRSVQVPVARAALLLHKARHESRVLLAMKCMKNVAQPS